MKQKVFTLVVITLLLSGSISLKDQTTPFYTNSIESGLKDDATNRLIIGNIFSLPEIGNNYTLDKSVRIWAKDFLNFNTGYKLTQEDTKNNKTIESFYKLEFIKKTSPKNEKMGVNISFEFSNRYIVTYNAFIGHALNDVVCNMDIATFDRNDGHRLSIKEIFKCDENTIKKLMYDNRPDMFPCDLSSANDIRIVNAGINRRSIDVTGTIFKGNTVVYQIPFEDAAEYLTEKAYNMHGMVVTRKGTIFSEDGTYSHAVKYFTNLLRCSSVSFGQFHNMYNDRSYSTQVDVKYDFDKNGKVKSKNPKTKIYLEIPSDDDNKEVYLELSKSEAKTFVDDLQKYLKEYNSWKKKMTSQKFEKYKPSTNGDGKFSISFYRLNDNTYSYEENRDYVCQSVYDKVTKKTALIFKSKTKEGTVKKLLNLASNSDKNLNMELREDNLSGWTLVLVDPSKEVPEICKAIQGCIDKMK